MWRSRVCERLPERPREQDCVTRPLPSLFCLRPFLIFQMLPPLRSQHLSAKSLFWNILPISHWGSIFCGESFLVALCFQYFARDRGEGGHQLTVVRRRHHALPLDKPKPLPYFRRFTERETISPSKSLRIKQLLVSRWGSIACGENFRNPLILKNRGRGVGVTRTLLVRPEMGKQRTVNSNYGVVNSADSSACKRTADPSAAFGRCAT